MKHFISKDSYYSFKEYPNKGNIINSISGYYANNGEETETHIVTTDIVEFPKTENPLSTKAKSRYDFPKDVTITIQHNMSSTEIAQYNKGFRYEIWVLRARNKRNAKDFSSDNLEYAYDYFNDGYSTDFSNVTEDSYYKLTSGYLQASDTGIYEQITFSNYINKDRYSNFLNSDGMGLHVVKQNEAVTYYEPTIFGTPYYVQVFLYGYIIKIYGINSDLEFNEQFKFSDNTGYAEFNVELQNNEILTKGSNYKSINLANNMANRIFNAYKDGRPTAELEWIGDPNVKVGDEVEVEPKNSNSNITTYFVYGKSISFNGGYGETLYIVKKSVWTVKLSISTNRNQNYVVLIDNEHITGNTYIPQYSTVIIPMEGNEDSNRVFINDSIYNLPALEDISFIADKDTTISFSKQGGIIS